MWYNIWFVTEADSDLKMDKKKGVDVVKAGICFGLQLRQ